MLRPMQAKQGSKPTTSILGANLFQMRVIHCEVDLFRL